jgi:hypothetical protein
MKHRNNAVMAADHIEWLRAFADSKGGIGQAAGFLGLSRDALTRAIAGLGIHRGTAALLIREISERTSMGMDERP